MKYVVGAAILAALVTWALRGTDARAGMNNEMQCFKVKGFAPIIDRCENNEAVCYQSPDGLSCFKK